MRRVTRETLAGAHRVVVKVGSSSLTGADGRLDVAAVEALSDVLAEHRASGQQLVLVSSGAIAAGLGPLGMNGRPRDLATAQAAASVGQGLLMAHYTEAFAHHGQQVGQVLLTVEDVVSRAHYRNALRTLDRLLDLGVLPIVNENDTVATHEIRFGDNDRLAALVSHLTRADALVLLSDVDALYDAPPDHEGARRIETVTGPEDLAEVEIGGSGSDVGTGGMVTKLDAASIATGSGIPVLLTSAANVGAALAGEQVGTWFAATGSRKNARRLWVAHAARAAGRVVLDDGAVRAITVGKKSLLAAGIVGVDGDFDAGDVVELTDVDGVVVARGVVGYASAELPRVLGKSSATLRDELGHDREVVHRDHLAVVRHHRR
ncbi:glutamate 5-kinase [Actinotalea sp. M2MS4P-6]|uniref:glutamate 5-kinase n=1 Tax=Actinotalea sp. M2MS4P-6 TaxID=2983762 RepID=UPI0021E450FC|nr:glutamate 5-kinase [Actinotalea sp. M2MS4P-6]MCV2393963.1 glutamate 5-kinase [Actinotalea sp. M2MS4P-6]